MAEEQVDILNEGGKPTGEVRAKKEAHRLGLWHRSAHIWIYNSRGEVLIQKRCRTKDSYPLKWDISAAGHVSAGEEPIAAAIRELREEIGISITQQEIEHVQTRKIVQDIDEKDWHNREFSTVFIWRFDGDITKLRLQEEEVERIEFVPIESFESDIKDKQRARRYVPHGQYYIDIIRILKSKIPLSDP